MDDDAFLGFFCFGVFIGGAIGGIIGSSRNNVVGGIIFGALLGPIGWILTLFLDNRIKCPDCKLPVPDGAQRCGHCGHEFFQRSPEKRSESSKTITESNKKKCPFCAELIQLDAIKCRYCGSDLQSQLSQEREKPNEVEEKPLHPLPEINRVTIDMAGQFRIPCPLCSKQILVSSLKSGENFCPHCFEKFNVE
jgi:hypothetical protein